MSLTVALILSLLFDGYHHFLIWKCKQLIAKGGCHSEWVKLNTLKEDLRPWKGFFLFLNPLLLMAIVEDWMGVTFPGVIWAIVWVIGLAISYNGLLRYIPMFYRARFVKSANPHHTPKWLIKCTWNSFGHTFQSEYPRTHAFVRLAGRLIICNTIGHRWTSWEAVKYGDFGNCRSCKVCLINETKHRGVSDFCETHNRTWRRIVNPNSVFRRKYIQPKF